MTLNHLQRDELEHLLRESLSLVSGNLSEQDRRDVSEYLDYGEYGVAYDLLTFAIGRLNMNIPACLTTAGKKMGLL